MSDSKEVTDEQLKPPLPLSRRAFPWQEAAQLRRSGRIRPHLQDASQEPGMRLLRRRSFPPASRRL